MLCCVATISRQRQPLSAATWCVKLSRIVSAASAETNMFCSVSSMQIENKTGVMEQNFSDSDRTLLSVYNSGHCSVFVGTTKMS